MRLPSEIALPRAWDTAAAALTACARALGDRRDVGAIAAASGLAFRLSVDDRVGLGGPHAYPWAAVLPAAAERLGYAVSFVASDESGALGQAAQARALALIDAGLAAGRPTLLWGVHAPEFGLVVGRNGDTLAVSGILDGAAPDALPAAALGRGELPVVFALQLTGRATFDEADLARAALAAALLLGRGPAPLLAGFHGGAAAWRAVDNALASGGVDPAGLAYAAQRWAESRAHAAAWLPDAARTLAVDLAPASGAFARAAAMLAELAALHPFPPAPSTMLTNSDRDQAQALVVEAARAEAAGLDAIAAALGALDRRRADALRVVPLDGAHRDDLFACIGELPIAGLASEAAECRARGALRGQLLYDGAELVGHVLYAPLDDARYPVAADGVRWFLYCPWLARPWRGRQVGARLFAALEADARAAGVDGLLTFTTTDERFLHEHALARHGFVAVARRGELRLCERALSDRPSRARLVDPPAPPPGHLTVLVRHGYNCPLLLRTRRDLANIARAAGAPVDEADAGPDPSGAAVDGRPVPHNYLPPAQLRAAFDR